MPKQFQIKKVRLITHHLLVSISLAFLLSVISITNAFAFFNPFLPPNCSEQSLRHAPYEASTRPVKIKVGNTIYVSSPGSDLYGGIVGMIDATTPSRSKIAIGLPPIPLNDKPGLTLWDAAVAGMWVLSKSTVASLAVPREQDVRSPELPWSRPEHTNRLGPVSKYRGLQLLNQTYYYQQGHQGSGGLPQMGTQVMGRAAKELIARAILKGESFELGAMWTHARMTHLNEGPDYGDWGDDNGSLTGTYYRICREKPGYIYTNVPHDGGNLFAGYYASHLTVQSSVNSQLEITPYSGTVLLTSSNVIYSVPAGCINGGDEMLCPIRTESGSLADGFTFEVPAAMQNKVWLVVNGQKTEIMRGSDLKGTVQLGVSADYLDELLGAKDEMYLNDIVMILKPDLAHTHGTPISLWSDVLLKRITFGVEITERNPSANGSYSGVVGQDPDIVVPLSIRQFGMSRASKVQVNVLADNVQTHEGLQCKFVGNEGATVVGIPSKLRFYNGSELIDRSDNCTGRMHDITKMRWRETLGGLSPYDAHLDMDLIFPLGPSVRLDTSRNEWFGRVEAKGEVRVRAEWN